MKEYKLYILRDPRSGMIRYVGITEQSLTKRLIKHCRDLKYSCHRVNWIKLLAKEGVRPDINLIKSYSTREEAIKAEIQCIKLYRGCGMELVNKTKGGDGLTGQDAIAASRCKKPVIDSNGTIYESARAAERELGISEGNVSAVCKNKKRTTKGLAFSYDLTSIPEVRSKITLTKPVIDSNGKIFQSIKEASEFYSISYDSIKSVCLNKNKTAGGVSFKWYSEGDTPPRVFVRIPYWSGKIRSTEDRIKMSNSKRDKKRENICQEV